MKYYGIDWKNTISKIIRPPVWPFGGIGTALTNNVISLPAGLALSHSVIHPFSYIYMYICISFSFRFSLSVSLATLSSIHFCSFFYSFLSPFFGMEGWGRGTALKKYPFSFLLNKVFRTWPRVWETKRKKKYNKSEWYTQLKHTSNHQSNLRFYFLGLSESLLSVLFI